MLKVIIHDENLMPINIYGQNYAEFISMKEEHCNICRNTLILGELGQEK